MIIIESGMIYSACLIILLSLYLSGSFAQYIVLDGVTQVIGIVFSLIIVRVGLGLSTDAATYTSQAFMSTFAAQPGGNARENAQFSVRATGRPRNDKFRDHKPDFPVTSTLGSMFASRVDTQNGTYSFSSSDQIGSTFSTSDTATRSEGQKERRAGTARSLSLGYLPEDDVAKSGDDSFAYAEIGRNFHPFHESVKANYLEEETAYAENHELQDRVSTPGCN